MAKKKEAREKATEMFEEGKSDSYIFKSLVDKGFGEEAANAFIEQLKNNSA